MAQWIETKLRYNKVMENVAVKKVTEPYLVDALSFTEAEARITEEMRSYISGEFSVSAAKKQKITEVLDDCEGDRWYKVRAMFISIDEKNGSEKKMPHDYIVRAFNIEDAIINFKSEMNLMVDYELSAVAETPIMDVFHADLSNNR